MSHRLGVGPGAVKTGEVTGPEEVLSPASSRTKRTPGWRSQMLSRPVHRKRRTPCPCHSSLRHSRGVLQRPTVGCRLALAQLAARFPATSWVDALSTSQREGASAGNVHLRSNAKPLFHCEFLL